MASISYNPQFQHQDWIDNVDRVQAGGPNGFNGHFHALEAEFQAISQAIAQISTALDALGTKPPPTPVKISLAPALVPTAVAAWVYAADGTASKAAGQTGAHGVMGVQLPAGATVQTMRVNGRNADSSGSNPGAGRLQIGLFRLSVDPTTRTGNAQLALVNAVGATFDTTIAANNAFAAVDNDHYHYVITADLDGAAATDGVSLNSVQITVL